MKTIINVGRQFGSGGRSVANALGKKLGIPVYDSELITIAAEKSGFSKDLLSRQDEKKKFFYTTNDAHIFKIQSEAIRDIAEKGDAIFIGRASDYVLRDMHCLDVFISAPMEDRQKRVAERENISETEAQKYIEKMDRRREDYYNFYTFGAWGVASNYDLCIDSTILGIEGTADAIIEFGKRAGYIG